MSEQPITAAVRDGNPFPLMARFNAWANERLYGAVAGLSEEDYRKDRKAFFGSIHNTLNHLLIGDLVWMARIEGTKAEGVHALDQILYDDLESLSAVRVEEDRRLITLVDGLADDGLGEPVVYTRMVDGSEQRTRLDHTLLTLFNHQTHHRGQVHAMLTHAGVKPPPLDIIDYLGEVGLS